MKQPDAPSPRRWPFAGHASDKDKWLVFPERAWWCHWWRKGCESTFWRFLSALGVWDTDSGGYWRKGWWTWENRYARSVPEFPRDGREFWLRVWHGDVCHPANPPLKYYPDPRPRRTGTPNAR